MKVKFDFNEMLNGAKLVTRNGLIVIWQGKKDEYTLPLRMKIIDNKKKSKLFTNYNKNGTLVNDISDKPNDYDLFISVSFFQYVKLKINKFFNKL
jgi:hypothetical protein